MSAKPEKAEKENTNVPDKRKGTTTPRGITRSTLRHTKDRANDHDNFTHFTTKAAIRGNEHYITKERATAQGFTTKEHVRGKAAYMQPLTTTPINHGIPQEHIQDGTNHASTHDDC